ncbi:outer membrane lipid asymmetry maintenance protein MlaD [Xanthomonas theicola]|uniref:Outer membrane lipid asymmetry maintenance protein MlaD n=1 Tax=Xanthomonas theicola TaxID=56464 RepID=A0A2S6ZD53_9XANT|nr:outer membrane lipid asymmetry maintenance protein MlaD [Xanthomonas theicola]PPT89232.1 outer membrane lipid asymmetry maintenance protein MlaD [Xanthomonas theicola]QNH26331.1 outer membrane lipid asymmetry maintenance protein MlaD [Xanthomonas theicola]
MAIRGPRLEFAVGAFLLLGLASLLVLALASTNRQWGFDGGRYALTARFSQIGQLRQQAPVKIGGVIIGQVASIELDPAKFDSVVTLAIDDRYKDLPADTSAGILTSGLLGESYVGLQPGGDPETLKPGGEIAFTQPAVDLIQLVGKYMFGGGGGTAGTTSHAASSPNTATPSTETEPKP